MTYSRTLLTAVALFACEGAACAERSSFATAGGLFEGESLSIALLETRANVTPHLWLTGAVAYLDTGGGHDEMQLRLMASGAWSMARWTIENRHMITLSSSSVERYRMRLRVARPGLFGAEALSLRAFDELFFDFDRRQWLRNNVALGFGVQMTPALSGELYHVWEDNRPVSNQTYLLGLVTYRFGR